MTSRKRQRLEQLDRDTASHLFQFLPNSSLVALDQSHSSNSNVLNAVNVWQNRQLDLRFPNAAAFVDTHLSLRPVTVLVSYEFGLRLIPLNLYASLRRVIVYEQPFIWNVQDDLQHLKNNVTLEFVSPIHARYVLNVLLPRNRGGSVRCVWFLEQESHAQLVELLTAGLDNQIQGILLTEHGTHAASAYEQNLLALDTIQIGTGSKTFAGHSSPRYQLPNFSEQDSDGENGAWFVLVERLRRVQSLQVQAPTIVYVQLRNPQMFDHLTFLRHFELEIYRPADCQLFIRLLNTKMVQLESASLILNEKLSVADCIKLRFTYLPKLRLTVVVKHMLFNCRQKWPTVKHLHLRLHDQDSPSNDRDFKLGWLNHCVPNVETLVIEDYFLERHSHMSFSEDASLGELQKLRKLHFVGESKNLLLVPSRVAYTFEQKPMCSFIDRSIMTWKRDYFATA